MKIYGPYLRKDGRQHVIIIYSDGARRTVSYPKWLREQEEGLLKDNEVVHHVDEDFTNNSLENLEVKGRAKHASDHHPGYGEIELECIYCKKKFMVNSMQLNHRNRKATGPYCSRSCAGKATYKNSLKESK